MLRHKSHLKLSTFVKKYNRRNYVFALRSRDVGCSVMQRSP
jgi:hypothetical protein